MNHSLLEKSNNSLTNFDPQETKETQSRPKLTFSVENKKDWAPTELLSRSQVYGS